MPWQSGGGDRAEEESERWGHGWVMWKRSCVVGKGSGQLENMLSKWFVCVPCHAGCRQGVLGRVSK